MDTTACAGVVVNIEAELAHWQQHYPAAAFHRQDFQFNDYVASLKFAYDAYLRYYRQPLDAMLPELHRRYRQDVGDREQLDWQRMASLLAVVWERLQQRGAENASPANTISASAYRRPASNGQRPGHRSDQPKRMRTYPWLRGLANVNLKEVALDES